jgi:hypothetical protein
LHQGSPPFMVRFTYLEEGIRLRKKNYPILKMNWIDGITLNEFVRKHVDKPQVMYRLAQMWVKLSLQLRQTHMAHADLQHGNVLLVPGEKASQLALRLIDYDGMYVPLLAHSPSGEVGHPNYQHPQRLRESTYNSEVDRFPHLLIYTALRCLTTGGRELWDKHDNGENLLFRERDFVHTTESSLLLDLWQLPDSDIRRLLGHLLLGSQLPLDRVALLDEVVGSEGRPLALTAAQERQVLELLPAAAAQIKVAPVLLSPFSLEELTRELEHENEEASPAPAGAMAVAGSAASATLAPPPSLDPDRQRRRTGIYLPGSSIELTPDRAQKGGRPLLPTWQVPCWHCSQKKHVFKSICPHCQRVDWYSLTAMTVAALQTLTTAIVLLRMPEPEVLPILGLVSALLSILLVPAAAGMLAQVLEASQQDQADPVLGPRWPSTTVVCRRCSRMNTVPLFACRFCGRINWSMLAVVAGLASSLLTLVAIGQALPQSPSWWQTIMTVCRWTGRLLGCLATFTFLLGVFELWKLQPRLPKEYRLRSEGARLVLVGVTAFPIVLAVLFFIGLVGY